MVNTLSVAKYFYDKARLENGYAMSEMKMHKLMYFTQRESLMINDTPLFEDSFYGWRFGPVLYSVREEYRKTQPFESVAPLESLAARDLCDSVYKRYGNMTAWDLSSLSHEEFSWKKAREGLDPTENGTVSLSVNAMRLDALREEMARAKEV